MVTVCFRTPDERDRVNAIANLSCATLLPYEEIERRTAHLGVGAIEVLSDLACFSEVEIKRCAEKRAEIVTEIERILANDLPKFEDFLNNFFKHKN